MDVRGRVARTGPSDALRVRGARPASGCPSASIIDAGEPVCVGTARQRARATRDVIAGVAVRARTVNPRAVDSTFPGGLGAEVEEHVTNAGQISIAVSDGIALRLALGLSEPQGTLVIHKILRATVAAAASLANERVPGVDRSGSLSRAGPNGERDQEGTHVSQGRVAKAPDEVVSACVPVCIAGTLAA